MIALLKDLLKPIRKEESGNGQKECKGVDKMRKIGYTVCDICKAAYFYSGLADEDSELYIRCRGGLARIEACCGQKTREASPEEVSDLLRREDKASNKIQGNS